MRTIEMIPEGLALMRQAAIDLGSKARLADALGLSRTTVSLVLSGKYPGRPDAVYARAVEVFGGHECPASGQRISAYDCRMTRTAQPPVHNPHAMRRYRVCQSCRHNPAVQEVPE